MSGVPAALTDLGLTAVSLFLFVSAIYLILKIVQAVKGMSNKGEAGQMPRTPCLQSPQLQSIVTTQARMMDAVCKVEEGGEAIKDNMLLQTKLMEQMGHVLERLSDLAVRREARFDALERLLSSKRGKESC